MKKTILNTLSIGFATMFFISCGSAGGDNQGSEYAPNMYVSEAYEPMTQVATEDPNAVNGSNKINPLGMNMRLPAKGTIARGQLDYATYSSPNTYQAYEAASALKNPIPATEENLKEGKRLYNINCTPCHAEDGKGEGTIVKDGKYPRVPNYADRLPTIDEGRAFFSISHGKNLMGSYGSVLTPTQRWQVVHYIYQLSGVSNTSANSSK